MTKQQLKKLIEFGAVWEIVLLPDRRTGEWKILICSHADDKACSEYLSSTHTQQPKTYKSLDRAIHAIRVLGFCGRIRIETEALTSRACARSPADFVGLRSL